MFKHSLPSIEQFAAYLDGNLSQSEMQQFSQLAEQDNALHQLLDASTEIDNTLAGFMDSDLQLPSDIMGLDFELPAIPAEGVSPLVTLSPEPMNDIFVVACADENMSLFSEIDQEEHLISGDTMHDNTTPAIPSDDSLDNNLEDLSNSFSEDF